MTERDEQRKSIRRERGGTMVFQVLLVLVSVVIAAAAFAAMPLAGTSIGNQASATYTDASLINRTATSNTVVTIVQQVGAVTLAADGAKYSNPGGTVYYPHTLTNTGNGDDSFVFSTATGSSFIHTGVAIYADANGDGVPDNAVDINATTVGPIPSGGLFRFVVAGTVPGSATNGQVGTITVRAKNAFDAYPIQSNTDASTVTGNAVISMTKSASLASGNPGTPGVAYTLTYTNTGNSTATNVVLKDTIPTGMTYVGNSAQWSVTGATVLTDLNNADAQGSAPNTIVYDYGVTAAGRVTAVINQVAAGQSGMLTFQVNVDSAAASGTANNIALYSYDPDGAGAAGQTADAGTNTVGFAVNQVAGLVSNGSSTNRTNGWAEPVIVPSSAQGSTVSFPAYVWNTGNGTDSFDLSLSGSTYPAGTTYVLYKSDGVTPLVDTNGNGVPDTGPIAANGSYEVVLKVLLPPNATGGPYSVTLTATSRFNNTVSESTVDTLTIISSSAVDVTNTTPRLDSVPSGTAAAGNAATTGWGTGPEGAAVVAKTVNPGVTANFTLYVNNTAGPGDTYDLTASTDQTFAALTLPSGWGVVFKADGGSGDCSTVGATITNTGMINSNANKAFCAVVTTPANGSGAASGNTEVYFRALSSTSGSRDIIHDRVSVSAIRSLSITPNNNGQVFPGGSVAYSFSVVNNGNVLEGDGLVSSSTLTAVNAPSPAIAGWTAVIYWDRNNDGALDGSDPIIANLSALTGGTSGASTAAGLDPGESARIFVKVQAPAGASTGDTNTTTLTATTVNGSYGTSAPAPASATAISTAITGQVTLLKEQALDAACDGTPDTAYSLVNVTTGAVPGACIRYRITATNVGAVSVANLVVSDGTPANTVYDNGSRNSTGGSCGTGAADAPAATTMGSITSAPACDGVGTISANVGALASAQSAVITFGVMINK